MVSSQHSPSRIIPQRGQVSDHSSKPARSEHWRVFHEHEARSHLANDSGHLTPEAASFSCEPGTISGDGDVLAREAPSEYIHHATPWLAIECAHIIPDGEWIEAAVILSGEEHAARIVGEFDSADGAPTEQLAAEYSASSACE